jgi:hypothetical protein
LLTFSAKELEPLAEHSERHYDAICRSMSQPGGVVYGFINLFHLGEPPFVVEIDRRTLDLLCKVMERPNDDAAAELSSSLRTTLLERPLETFLLTLAVEITSAENERDQKDAAMSVLNFMNDSELDSGKLAKFLEEADAET